MIVPVKGNDSTIGDVQELNGLTAFNSKCLSYHYFHLIVLFILDVHLNCLLDTASAHKLKLYQAILFLLLYFLLSFVGNNIKSQSFGSRVGPKFKMSLFDGVGRFVRVESNIIIFHIYQCLVVFSSFLGHRDEVLEVFFFESLFEIIADNVSHRHLAVHCHIIIFDRYISVCFKHCLSNPQISTIINSSLKLGYEIIQNQVSFVFLNLLLVSKCQSIKQWQLLTFSVFEYLQLTGYIPSLERGVHRLTTLRQKYCKSVLIAVESEVLPDELVNDQVLVGQVRSAGRVIVEGTENFSPDFSSNLREDSSLLKCFLQNIFEFVNACHQFKYLYHITNYSQSFLLLFLNNLLFSLFRHAFLVLLLHFVLKIVDQVFGLPEGIHESIVHDQVPHVLKLFPDILSDLLSPLIVLGFFFSQLFLLSSKYALHFLVFVLELSGELILDLLNQLGHLLGSGRNVIVLFINFLQIFQILFHLLVVAIIQVVSLSLLSPHLWRNFHVQLPKFTLLAHKSALVLHPFNLDFVLLTDKRQLYFFSKIFLDFFIQNFPMIQLPFESRSLLDQQDIFSFLDGNSLLESSDILFHGIDFLQHQRFLTIRVQSVPE